MESNGNVTILHCVSIVAHLPRWHGLLRIYCCRVQAMLPCTPGGQRVRAAVKCWLSIVSVAYR